jgi:hypothetical protein
MGGFFRQRCSARIRDHGSMMMIGDADSVNGRQWFRSAIALQHTAISKAYSAKKSRTRESPA